MQNRAGCPNRRRVVFQSKTIQGGNFEVVPHGKHRRLWSENPIFVTIENGAKRSRWIALARLFPPVGNSRLRRIRQGPNKGFRRVEARTPAP